MNTYKATFTSNTTGIKISFWLKTHDLKMAKELAAMEDRNTKGMTLTSVRKVKHS